MADITAVSNTFRFFVASSLIAQEATDEAALIHQWVRVLRIRRGQQALLIDETTQQAYQVQFDEVSKQRVTWRTLAVTQLHTEPALQVSLAVGMMRAERFEWLLQKATEIGVRQIIPVIAERSRSDGSVSPQKIERWQRILREAAEQACRARIPDLHHPVTLATLLHESFTQAMFLHEGAGTVPLRSLLPVTGAQVLLVSGPEGGLSDAECALMQHGGWQGVGLGQRILRAETAPLVAATMALAYAGEFDG